ncbi:MAG: helix-turn-helix domain-containing protein [Clostridia bacterium]|nr:helix-turn-helix domain-containing protein [Clostridia bacterium]
MSNLHEYKYENKKDDFYYRETKFSATPLACHPHLHSHIELGILLEGKTDITIDSKKYTLEAGDMFVCFPNQVHGFKTLEKEYYILFIFNPEIISEFSNLFFTKLPKTGIIRNAAENSELRDIIQLLANTYRSSDTHKTLAVKGYLLILFSKILEELELNDIQSGDIKLIGAILNYCSKNYNQPLSLSILERELHISKFYISHTLSNKLHISFNDYINSLRIMNACKLLQSTKKSVTEISEAVGFNTLRTFNRAFIKHTGTTPSKYRTQKSPLKNSSLPL